MAPFEPTKLKFCPTGEAAPAAREDCRPHFPGTGNHGALLARVGRLLVVATALGVAGCGRQGSQDSSQLPAGAKVQVINRSGHEWLITLTRLRSGKTHTARLAPHATHDVTVPSGDYRIDQAIASGEAAAAVPRQFTANLETGQSYRWSLTTLLSESGGSFPAAAGARGGVP